MAFVYRILSPSVVVHDWIFVSVQGLGDSVEVSPVFQVVVYEKERNLLFPSWLTAVSVIENHKLIGIALSRQSGYWERCLGGDSRMDDRKNLTGL